MQKFKKAYIFPVHQCFVCTFSTAVLCHAVALQSSAHSLVGNFLDTSSLPGRKMVLDHTKSSPGQKWLLVLGFCTVVSCHKVQFLVSWMQNGEHYTPRLALKLQCYMDIVPICLITIDLLTSILWQDMLPGLSRTISAVITYHQYQYGFHNCYKW